jgi:6-phosphofructokinase 1
MRTRAKRCIGILTAGGDCPGLNAAIRAVAKSAHHHGIQVLGFMDGFRGLVENRSILLEDRVVSGILTQGGTLLGTSRDKPHKMDMGGKVMDMTAVAVANAKRLQLECVVCLGGNGTQKNAWQLHKNGGLNVLTLPKTIDNDVALTDICFGFDTALTIATEAIDRLHTTATSHHRIIVCEVMGHAAGWLALGSGIAGGADVILLPEIPYDLHAVADFILARRHSGKRFSIIAMAEGARSLEEAQASVSAPEKGKKAQDRKKAKEEAPPKGEMDGHLMIKEPKVSRLARDLQELTGIEVRTTSLGHVQRGGTPTPTDRLLCTRLGTVAGELIAARHYNVMVGVRGEECVPVPLDKVAGVVRCVPAGHAWLQAAARVGTCLGVHGAE